MPRNKTKAKAEKDVAKAIKKRNPSWDNVAKHKFQKGQTGNPGGRPKKFLTLVSHALREKLKEVSEDGVRTYAEVLADKLVTEATDGQLPVKAIAEIIDRVEGKPKQQIDVNDVTDKFSGRTKEELAYFAQHGKFPDVQG